MDLCSYLLKPLQRLGKYALILKQILKECPSTSNEFLELTKAAEMIDFSLQHGNDLLAMDALLVSAIPVTPCFWFRVVLSIVGFDNDETAHTVLSYGNLTD